MSYLITFSTPAGTTRRAEPDLPAARLWITRNMPQDLREQADNLPDAGGTIQLSDAATITVEPVALHELLAELGWPNVKSSADALEAFNAQENSDA